ncbi:hypothetical protein AMK12_21295 [Streptomyces sp. TSRI0395]|nr:hypothetical protein AMK12_21295 [Streptomyces sp. TSRI0395]
MPGAWSAPFADDEARERPENCTALYGRASTGASTQRTPSHRGYQSPGGLVHCVYRTRFAEELRERLEGM